MKLWIPACVFSLWAIVAPSYGEQSCKPVVGHFEASVVPPGTGHCPDVPAVLCTAGRVWGGIKGSYQFVMAGAIPVDLPPGLGGFASLITFNGGTGKMTGATGQIRLTGEFDAAEGAVTGDYIGTLCTP
jgi:hypothetical protein